VTLLRRLDKNDDVFVIATSEQTFCGFHLNEATDKISHAGFSTCFRKDNWSIFRVHQFCITATGQTGCTTR
jgi:seryl-tRNA synthetase